MKHLIILCISIVIFNSCSSDDSVTPTPTVAPTDTNTTSTLGLLETTEHYEHFKTKKLENGNINVISENLRTQMRFHYVDGYANLQWSTYPNVFSPVTENPDTGQMHLIDYTGAGAKELIYNNTSNTFTVEARLTDPLTGQPVNKLHYYQPIN